MPRTNILDETEPYVSIDKVLSGDSDSDVIERKIGAIVGALFKPRQRKRGMSDFLVYQNEPFSTVSGDFFWARKFKDAALVVVGDATGHNAYSGLLSIVACISLDNLARRAQRRDVSGHDRLIAPKSALIDLAKQFSAVMKPAVTALRKRNHGPLAKNMENEGFCVVACAIRGDKILIATAGLPAYLVFASGVVKKVGTYDDVKNITAKKGSEANVGEERAVNPNVRFVVFATDGIVEQIGENKKAFQTELLAKALRRHMREHRKKATAKSLLKAVFGAVRNHQGAVPNGDDRLVVVLDTREWQENVS